MLTAGVIGAGAAGRAVAAHAGLHGTAPVERADVVFLAVRSRAVPAAARRVGDWTGRIVVDLTDAQPADREGTETDSERVLRLLPGSRLVKVLPAPMPAETPHRRAIFLAGDDEPANDTVTDLLQGWGFAVVDVGSLRDGGSLMQPGGPLFGLMAVVRD